MGLGLGLGLGLSGGGGNKISYTTSNPAINIMNEMARERVDFILAKHPQCRVPQGVTHAIVASSIGYLEKGVFRRHTTLREVELQEGLKRIAK